MPRYLLTVAVAACRAVVVPTRTPSETVTVGFCWACTPTARAEANAIRWKQRMVMRACEIMKRLDGQRLRLWTSEPPLKLYSSPQLWTDGLDLAPDEFSPLATLAGRELCPNVRSRRHTLTRSGNCSYEVREYEVRILHDYSRGRHQSTDRKKDQLCSCRVVPDLGLRAWNWRQWYDVI
jgi:hypothetical protein